jgi:hypothetical protein
MSFVGDAAGESALAVYPPRPSRDLVQTHRIDVRYRKGPAVSLSLAGSAYGLAAGSGDVFSRPGTIEGKTHLKTHNVFAHCGWLKEGS